MKSFRLSRFFSLLLIMAIVVATAAWMKDPFGVVILSAIALNGYIVPLLVKRSTRRRGWVFWACASCVLAGAYYLADLLLMPSHRTPFYIWEAALLSLVSMVGGLAATYYAPPARVKAAR